MATKRMMKTTKTNNSDISNKVTETENTTVATTTETKERVFDPEEYIDCKAVKYGVTFIEGMKTKEVYQFEGENDIVGVAYKDLENMVRTRSSYLFAPWIIVIDEDFVAKFPKLKEFYDSMYSTGDIRAILNLSDYELKNVLATMPSGILDSVKSTAMSMIANGTMDSVRKIRTLDDFFGTKMMEMTGLYGDE